MFVTQEQMINYVAKMQQSAKAKNPALTQAELDAMYHMPQNQEETNQMVIAIMADAPTHINGQLVMY